MSLYAIGDLHLCLGAYKPMDVFGGRWEGYMEKLREGLSVIAPGDTTVLLGDLSWALGIEQAEKDFAFLHEIPGRKIILKGNHDYWWTTATKFYHFCAARGWDDMFILNNNCYFYGETALCGTRGWLLPSAESFSDADRKIYNREGIRLELSLQQAHKIQAQQIITAFHYPPLFARTEHTCFTNLMLRYGVQHCVYGHIHGENHIPVFEGLREGIKYKLVSCDTQGFQLYKVI